MKEPLNLTPKYDYLPSKEKVVSLDPEMGLGQNLGGLKVNAEELSQGKVRIQGIAQRILIGDATAPLTGIGIFVGSDQAATIGYDFRVGDPSGSYLHWDASASTLTIVGAISGSSGTIGGWTINSTSIYTGTEDHSGYTANAGDMTLYSDGTDSSIHAFNFYIDTSGNYHARSGDITGVSISSIPNDSSTDISLMEKSHNLIFSVTDSDTISWSSGTIVMSNGRTFTISAGNTGNMVALTYIYLDTGISSTVLQTTSTYSTAMGANKVLLGVAQNNTVTASFIPYGPGQPLIDGANIGALSIVAGNIAASTITASKMSVSDLSAISANIGTITSGSISVVNGGNTIGFTPNGTNAIFSGPTGSPTFKVTPAGALTATSATITGVLTALAGSTLFDIQTFSSTGTWTKPSAANANSVVEVWLYGGGGGGGSGGRSIGASNWQAAGGSGGGGGGFGYKKFLASSLGATETVTIGVGGVGGVGVSVNNTNGNNGSNGGSTSFGTTVLLKTNGGGGGGKGLNVNDGSFGNSVAGIGAVSGNGDLFQAGSDGGVGRSDDAPGDTGVDTASLASPRGGGGGGCINSAGTAKNGGIGGGFITNYVKAGGAIATIGNSSIALFYGGTGGGGSSGNASGSASTGGAGINGSGGGGGGAASSTTGAGGVGGDGYVVVITRF